MNAKTSPPKRPNFILNICADGGTTQLLAFSLRSREPCHDAFTNDRAFELGEHPHHLKRRPPGWRAGIEPLLVKVQVAALGMDFAKETQQVGK